MFTQFPKDRKWNVCLRSKITKPSCRRRPGEALLRAEKFGDLMTADHKVLSEGCESRDSHRYAVAVRDFATKRIQSYPCKNKIFTWDWRKRIKILGAVAQTDSCIHRQLDGIWESAWRFITESPHFNTSSIRDKWHRWQSRSTSNGRYVRGIATIRTRWKVVVWLYGMLPLSAKRPRSLGRWENAIWKTIWRIIRRANNTFWSDSWISSYFTERSGKNSSIWKNYSQESFLVVSWSRGEFGKEMFW